MPRGRLAVLAGTFLFAACGGSESQNAASQVQEGLQAVAAEQATENPTERQRDPAQEERCANVTQTAMDEAEEKMKNLNQELVVMTGEETTALSCSRYRKYLAGEVESY